MANAKLNIKIKAYYSKIIISNIFKCLCDWKCKQTTHERTRKQPKMSEEDPPGESKMDTDFPSMLNSIPEIKPYDWVAIISRIFQAVEAVTEKKSIEECKKIFFNGNHEKYLNEWFEENYSYTEVRNSFVLDEEEELRLISYVLHASVTPDAEGHVECLQFMYFIRESKNYKLYTSCSKSQRDAFYKKFD